MTPHSHRLIHIQQQIKNSFAKSKDDVPFKTYCANYYEDAPFKQYADILEYAV